MSSGVTKCYCHFCEEFEYPWINYWDKTFYCNKTEKRVNRKYAMKKYLVKMQISELGEKEK